MTTEQTIILERLIDVPAEQRLEIFNCFCKECGSDNPECQCWNDE